MARILLVLLLALSCSLSLAQHRDENEIIDIHETDVEMNTAMLKANQSLSTFIERFNNPHEGDSNFALKVMVSDEYGVEHFWVTDLEITETGFSGFISNDAKTVKLVSMGQKVNFSQDIITDWSYDNNGVKQGAFTLKVLLKRMPKEQADYYKKAVGWN
jgi:uncharacterized protein YegJ (DUF2314 family)